MTAQHPAAPSAHALPAHISGLNGVRALAVIAVVWHHAHPGFAAVPASLHGFLGVDVFFVLSGFLITTLLLFEQSSTQRISLKNFYIRRSLRIFPLYYAVLAALTVYFWVASGGQRDVFFRELPFHLSYTSNWIEAASMMAITWSLSTEEQFYLLWPPLLVLFRRHAVAFMLVFLAFNQVINFGLIDGPLGALGLHPDKLPILQATFTPIVLGSLLAFALQGDSALKLWLTKLTTGPGLWLAVLALLALANMSGDLRGWPRLLFHGVATWTLAGVVLQPTHAWVRFLEWRPLAYVGTVSYGVYLLHVLALDLTMRVMPKLGLASPELRFGLCLLAAIGLAALSYHGFERPLLKLKDRFR